MLLGVQFWNEQYRVIFYPEEFLGKIWVIPKNYLDGKIGYIPKITWYCSRKILPGNSTAFTRDLPEILFYIQCCLVTARCIVHFLFFSFHFFPYYLSLSRTLFHITGPTSPSLSLSFLLSPSLPSLSFSLLLFPLLFREQFFF